MSENNSKEGKQKKKKARKKEKTEVWRRSMAKYDEEEEEKKQTRNWKLKVCGGSKRESGGGESKGKWVEGNLKGREERRVNHVEE